MDKLHHIHMALADVVCPAPACSEGDERRPADV